MTAYTHEVARLLGRSYKAVSVKAVRLKLSKVENNLWTNNEISFLKDNYPYYSNEELSNLMKTRTASAIQSMARLLNLKKEDSWTNEEIVTLTTLYPTHSNGEIAALLNRSVNSINLKANRICLTKPQLYTYNKHFFNNIDTEHKAYWLGFIYADGYVTKSPRNAEFGIELSTGDLSHLEKFNIDLDSNVPITFRDRKSPSSDNIIHICKLRFYSRDLVDTLISKGVVLNKTSILTFPIWLDGDLMPHFLRGFIDGDGYIRSKNNSNSRRYHIRMGFVCNSESFVHSLVSYVNNLFEEPIFYIGIDRGNYTVYTNNRRQFLLFLNYIYANSTIHLERKYTNYIDSLKHIGTASIRLLSNSKQL